MKRQAIRGLLLFGLLALAIGSARGQNITDSITVRNKDGTTKSISGTFTLTPAGFQVIAADKKVVATISPDDIVKFSVGELPGVDRATIRSAQTKEENHDYDAARALYDEQLKKAKLPERSKRYLAFKSLMTRTHAVDELDHDKGWKEKADDCIAKWGDFLAPGGDAEKGWEQWPAARAVARLQVERGKFDDAARMWSRVAKNPNMPPDARAEAALQQIDLQIRSKQYPAASAAISELAKGATGARKDRLAIYDAAAKAGGGGKISEGIEKIKAEMNKTKDASVHATGFSMMGELYLADAKPRDAMWMFLWVETVVNQDRDATLRALSRLADIFESQMDEEQVRKYREKLKRFGSSF